MGYLDTFTPYEFCLFGMLRVLVDKKIKVVVSLLSISLHFCNRQLGNVFTWVLLLIDTNASASG